MTSDGLVEVTEGDFAEHRDIRITSSAHVDGGTSGPIKRAETGSKGSHRHERRREARSPMSMSGDGEQGLPSA